jgi:LPS-assembly lipoprotein
MWWRDHTAAGRLVRLGVVLAAAGLLAGCFQPLYGDRPLGGADSPSLRQRMSGVDVAPIPMAAGSPGQRVAGEVRNALMFNLTGGGRTTSPTHQLKIQFSALAIPVIVDITTARPDVQQYGITATYTLVELATNKVVVTGQTFSRVSYDTPGQQQRFAQARGLRDAENRAAQVIADSIRDRLASYFVAGA